MKFGIISVCAPQLSGRILFKPSDARAIFLHKDFLGNDTCCATWGRITNVLGGGAQTEKVRYLLKIQVIAEKPRAK